MSEDDGKLVGVYEFFDALRDVIIASDPAKRETLRNTISDWARDDDAETYFWATGMQSPTLLHNLMMEIEFSCEPNVTLKPDRPVIRLVVDRKPQGRKEGGADFAKLQTAEDVMALVRSELGAEAAAALAAALAQAAERND
jgi:hypothetical protein